MNTLADSVSAASRSYCSLLAQLYPAASSATSVGVSASLTAVQLQRMSLDPSAGELQLQQEVVAALRREVQVKFSALVAAQTWLTQVCKCYHFLALGLADDGYQSFSRVLALLLLLSMFALPCIRLLCSR